ncbi:terminase large subunit, partial [Bacillus thuringiensis]|nr:terminase large subunit [Bacillus thuringiensis]
RLFPFILKLDNAEEVDNPDMWEKENPMFSKAMSKYARGLYKKVMRQYKNLKNDQSNRENFMTKMMNITEVDLTKAVAPWEENMRTGYE